MPGNTNRDKIEDPCSECKKRHVKCDDSRPKCNNCVKSNTQCIRPSERIKFRPGSTAKYDSAFAKGQQWPTKSRNAVFQFIDVNPDVEALYTSEHDAQVTAHRPATTTSPSDNDLIKKESPRTLAWGSKSATPLDTNATSPTNQSGSLSGRTTISPSGTYGFRTPLSPLKRSLPDDAIPRPSQPHQSRRRSPSAAEPVDMRNTYSLYERSRVPYGYPVHDSEGTMEQPSAERQRRVAATMQRLEDENAAAIPPDQQLRPSEWRGGFYWPNAYTTNMCTSLLRYFIEELGPWFDAGDPLRTFTTLVPRRARLHPPLLNAIFTAAAFHLSSSKRHRKDGLICYRGITLHKLTDSSMPGKYFSAALAYLSNAVDLESVRDDDFLAAAVILRFAEDFREGAPDEKHVFTPIFRGFMRARAEASTDRAYAPLIHYDNGVSPSPFAEHERQRQERAKSLLTSFEHACYRVALRQDICAFLLSQTASVPDHSIEIDLPMTWSALDAFPDPNADDWMWTDHHLRHLADVVRSCYLRGHSPGSELYDRLKSFERQWEANKPFSFSPYHDPDEYHNGSKVRLEAGKTDFVLPQCWFIDEINVIGVQYIELAMILMAESNPFLPRLGRARHDVEKEVRRSVTRICGMAMSDSSSVFAKELAFVAVALTTAYFKNKDEHRELCKVLESLETDYGWPIEGKRREILQLWGIKE